MPPSKRSRSLFVWANTSGNAVPHANAYSFRHFVSAPRQVIDQLDASLAIPQGDRSDYVIAAASIIASVRAIANPFLNLFKPCSTPDCTSGLCPACCAWCTVLNVLPPKWQSATLMAIGPSCVKKLSEARFRHPGRLFLTPARRLQVTRAKLMEQYARSWPQYNFERNWGHLDDLHRAALRVSFSHFDKAPNPPERSWARLNDLHRAALRVRTCGQGPGPF